MSVLCLSHYHSHQSRMLRLPLLLLYFRLAVAQSNATAVFFVISFCCANVGADNRQSDARWKKRTESYTITYIQIRLRVDDENVERDRQRVTEIAGEKILYFFIFIQIRLITFDACVRYSIHFCFFNRIRTTEKE